jgi:hypothetical protein
MIVDVFLGSITTEPPPGLTAADVPTDGTYWIERSQPSEDLNIDQTGTIDEALTVDPDPFNGNLSLPPILTATNLAEVATRTHELLANSIVLVFGLALRTNAQNRAYVFNLVPHRPIYVHLQLNTGTNGSVSAGVVHNATYTYDLLSPETDDPISGATALTPAGTREQGPLTGPATIGLARLSADGTTWTLIWTDERRAVIACP